MTTGSFSRDALSYQTGELVADRYEIHRPLGRGAFAAVYAGQHIGTGQPVAIKMLTANPETTPDDVVRRFVREARVTSRLTSPNTVRVFDVGQAADGPMFLVMELIDGVSLEDHLHALARHGETMTIDEALDVAIAMLQSVGEAHQKGLVHRDLKPANVMLSDAATGERTVKVVDFGIARSSDSSLTMAGKALGTPAYMSPEQVQGLPLDGRSDLYAIGVLLYRCITGALPFSHTDPYALAFKHVHDPVPSLDPWIDAVVEDPVQPVVEVVACAVADVIEKALAKMPGDRFADAREMRQTLEAIRGGAWADEPTFDPLSDVSVPVVDEEPPKTELPTVIPGARSGARHKATGLILCGAGLVLFGAGLNAPTSEAGDRAKPVPRAGLLVTLPTPASSLETPAPSPPEPPAAKPSIAHRAAAAPSAQPAKKPSRRTNKRRTRKSKKPRTARRAKPSVPTPPPVPSKPSAPDDKPFLDL